MKNYSDAIIHIDNALEQIKQLPKLLTWDHERRLIYIIHKALYDLKKICKDENDVNEQNPPQR